MPVTFFDGSVSFARSGPVLAGFWRAPFSHERLRRLREEATQLRREQSGKTLGMVAAFDSDAISLQVLTDQALRRDAARLQREFKALFHGGQCVALEGTGLANAALRMTSLAVQSIAGVSASHSFHASGDEALHTLAHNMQLDSSLLGELRHALEHMREQTRRTAGPCV